MDSFKILGALVCLAATLPALAADPSTVCGNDTACRCEGAKNLVLDIPFVDTESQESSENKKSRHRWFCTTGMLGLGWNITVGQTAGLRQKSSHSMGLIWGQVIGAGYRFGRKGPLISLGVGIDWEYWRSIGQGLYDWQPTPQRRFDIYGAPEGTDKPSTTVSAFYVMFPLVIRQPLPWGFSITGGVSLDLNTGVQVKSAYRTDGLKYSEQWDGLPHKTVGMSVMGALSWESLGVYVKYTPVSPIAKSTGIDFNSLSVGIAIGW